MPDSLKNAQLEKSPSPHIHEKNDSHRIMLDVLIALVPAVLGSIYIFGAKVLPYYIIAIVTAVVLDWFWRVCVRKDKRVVFDFTPVVTGTLLAMSLPASAPWWFAILGPAVGIIVAKELFGGVGRNFLNPAITGRLLLRILFVAAMTDNVWPRPEINVPAGIDAITSATPLMLAKAGEALNNEMLSASFWGNVGGKIGETSAFLLLIGAAYLFWRGVIRWRIPVMTLLAILAVSIIHEATRGFLPGYESIILTNLLGGATILGVFFMATDYSSSPSAPLAQILFAIALGVLMMLFRIYGSYSEGFTFALFIMNLTVPLFNKYFIPRVPGGKK